MSSETDPFDLLIDLKIKSDNLRLGETSRHRSRTVSADSKLIPYQRKLEILLEGDWVVTKTPSGLIFTPTYSVSEKSTNVLKRVAKKLFNGYDSYLDLLNIVQKNFSTLTGVTVKELLDFIKELGMEELKISSSDLHNISKKDPQFLSQVF